MTITEILEIEKLAHQPVGIQFIDDLFSLASTAIYYRFMYHLVRRMRPELVVELGVYAGRSTAHLAAATGCRVVAVDPKPLDVSPILTKYPNIDLRIDVSTSPSILSEIDDGSVDLCFIDTVHYYQQVTSELRLWLPKIRRGGVILFDDVSENIEMIRAWSEIQASHVTVSLPSLHHSGFGALVKES